MRYIRKKNNHSNRRILYLMIFGALAGTNSTHARTDLAGSIGGKILFATGNPYIVNENILIPDGESLTVKEGCRFFFGPYTGLTVNGSLTVEGTGKTPVHFTTINDTLCPIKTGQPPDPFDWNGITVSEKAGNVKLSHFTISYSVQGIKSLSDAIVIDSGLFLHNGQYNFTINGIVKKITGGAPFCFEKHGITYDANDATSGTVPFDSIRYDKGDTVTLASNNGTLAKPGHVFDGWNSQPDGTGIDYVCGTDMIMGGYDVTLYAKWKPEEVTPKIVTFMRKNRIPLLLGFAAIPAAGGSAWLYKQWKENGEGYENVTSIPRLNEIDARGHRLSAGSITAGIVSAAALSTGIYLFVKTNFRAEKQSTENAALFFSPAPNGCTATFTLPLKSFAGKGRRS